MLNFYRGADVTGVLMGSGQGRPNNVLEVSSYKHGGT